MLPFLRFTDYIRVFLLALTVAMVTLMNQRQIAVLQQIPAATSQSGSDKISSDESSRKTIVYQKVCFEATPNFAIPLPDADLVGILPIRFWQPVLAVTEHFLLAAGNFSGIPVALAGMLGSAILTRAP